MMNKFLVLVALILLVPGVNARAEDDIVKERELAKTMLSIQPVSDQVEAAINALSARVQPDKRFLFRTIIMNSIGIERIEVAAMNAMVDVYTQEELQAMVDFHGSDVAAQIREKGVEFDAAINPIIVDSVYKAVEAVRNNPEF